MRHTAVFIACLLCVLVASSNAASVLKTGLLTYNSQVVQSNGNGNQVTLANINACDPSQLWTFDSDGFIYQTGNPNLVLDVQNANPANGNPTIMWNKKTPTAANQQWIVNSTGVCTQLNGMCLRKSSTSQNVVTSSNSPVQQFAFTDAPPCPDTCTSHGDPHFTSWPGYRFDYQNPSTVLLAIFNGIRVYTNQFSCAPGVTCNEGFVVQSASNNDTFQLIGNTYAFYNKLQTTVAMGNTVFSSFVNVTRTSSTSYIVYIPGAYITWGVYKWGYGTYNNIGVTLTQAATLAPSLCVGPAAGQNPNTFGNQFIVTNQSSTAYQYAVTPYNYNPNYVPNYGPFTTNDTDLIQKTTSVCSQITSVPGLGQCASLVPSAFYTQCCYNDSYAMNNAAAGQMSVDVYAFLCTQAAQKNGTTVTYPTAAITTVVVGAVTTIGSGVTTTFTIVAKDINNNPRTTGGDNFTITSTGPTALNFTIVDNNNGTYTVTYTTGVEGSYNISVKLMGISDVSNSPFVVTVVASTSAATTSVVIGPVPNGQMSNFTIQARTSSGSNRSQGGDTFSVVFPSGSFTLNSIVDNGDGTYTVYYTPYSTGSYQIIIQYQGTSIQCSPYTVIVR